MAQPAFEITKHVSAVTALKQHTRELVEQGMENGELIASLEKWINENPLMKKQLLRYFVLTTADSVMRTEKRDVRRAIRRSADINASKIEHDSDLSDDASGLVEIGKNKLMNFPLTTGILLGEATAADLQIEIQHRRKSALTYVTDARFFELIKNSLGKNKKVKNALSEKKLIELRQRAKVEVS